MLNPLHLARHWMVQTAIPDHDVVPIFAYAALGKALRIGLILEIVSQAYIPLESIKGDTRFIDATNSK